MDEFKLLTSGVAFNRGKKSKDVRFAQLKQNDTPSSSSNVLNFFRESRVTPIEEFATPKSSDIRESVSSDSDAEKEEWFKSQEEVNIYRRKHRIFTYSRSSSHKDKDDAASVPWPIKTFQDLETIYKVNPWIVQNVSNFFKFKNPSR